MQRHARRRSYDAEFGAHNRRMGGGIRARSEFHLVEAPRRSGHGNLPAELTSFVGREAELAALAQMLDRSRLVTITGPPGAGKSRLALKLAYRLAPHRQEGGWLVELGSLAAPDRVSEVTARSLGIEAEHGRDWGDILAERLADWDALVIVDNCEHLLQAAGEMIQRVLASCPNLAVVATSRERLHLNAEKVWPLEPLADREAVALFTDRARSVSPGFVAQAELVGNVCRRVDGLPLGVELAAARVDAMSLEAIADRLADRFQLLTAGDRTAPARLKTLRGAVEWSHDLLEEPERCVFRRAAVFVDGFDLEAAENVCSDAGAAAAEVDKRLVALVEKSLIRIADGRYQLLETMRDFASEQLADAGETNHARRAHGAYCARFGEQAVTARHRPEESLWLNRLWADRANLRAAFDWACASDAEATAHLALAMSHMWWVRGDLNEALLCLETAMATPSADPILRTTVVVEAATFAEMRGDLALAHGRHEVALADAQALGNKTLLARCLEWSGFCLWREGQFAEARKRLDESLRLYEELGQPVLVASVLLHLVGDAAMAGDLATARRLITRAVDNCRKNGNERLLVLALAFLGADAYLESDDKLASESLEESIRLCKKNADHLAGCYVLGLAAALATRRSAFARALTLEAAAAALEKRIGIQREAVWARLVADAVKPALAHIAAGAADSAKAAGRALDFEEALAFAVEPVARKGAALLSRRELEVASLVAEGRSAKEIAADLFISERTAESHLERIRNKLGVHSRSQIAAWVVQERWLRN